MAIQLVSTPSIGTPPEIGFGAAGAGASYVYGEPSISADGRYVVFYSNAWNLVNSDNNPATPLDTNGHLYYDVFLRDTQTGTTTVLSSGGNDHSSTPSISANGRFVVFESKASTLVPVDAQGNSPDTNGTTYYDIFLHDTLTGQNTLLTPGVAALAANGGGDSTTPSISADGRFVVFTSNATLTANDTNSTGDVYIHDTLSGQTLLLSGGMSGASYGASISADGTSVTFLSKTDRFGNATHADADVFFTGNPFLYDLTVTTNLTAAGNLTSGWYKPTISADGGYVLFSTLSNNLARNANGDLTYVNSATGTLAHVPAGHPVPHGYVLIDDWDTGGFPNGTFTLDIHMYDTSTGAITYLTGLNSGGGSVYSSISADGRFVAYTYAPNISGIGYIYLRDLQTGTVTQLTSTEASYPSISADGRVVAFSSPAYNAAIDNNNTWDAFIASNPLANTSPTTPTDFINSAADSVAEGATNGTAVGITASSTDVNGPGVTYSLTVNADGRFAIDGMTGVVSVADAALLNYETAASHNITVQASDGAGGTSTQTFAIAVTNVSPTTPTDTDTAADSVAEGATNGTAVGITASSTDVNGPGVTYSLTVNADGRFAIDGMTGVVSVADAALLNYETAASHNITVQASDGAGGTSTQTFAIAVTNVNPTTPTDTDTAADSVAEGATNGTAVGITASSTDVNGPAVTYALTVNADGRFAIDGMTGVVSVADAALLNYETAASHNITVQASDGAGGTSTQTFAIAVTNVSPTTPTDTDTAADSVAEGATNGTAVGITASSTDVNGPGVTYSLTVNADGRFAIDGMTGVVSVADAALLNYETSASHNITVQASDGAGGTSTQTFAIAVTNVSPTTPTDTDTAADSVAEGATNGTAVGITASSTDVNGPAVTYALTVNADGRFAIDGMTGVVSVADAALLNYETAASHNITVQASDGAGGTSTQTFAIAVTNVSPTTPTDTGTAADSVAEGATNGTAVGITASSTDVNGPAVTYALTVNADGRFAIDGMTGVVSVADAALLNYETAASHNITVQASDGAGGTSTQTFAIAVTNVSPTTPTDTDTAAASVTEGAANGTAVGITAFSVDVNGPPVRYSLTNSANGRFAIDAITGIVTVANAALLNYETGTSHDITVEASDGAGGTSTQTFSIAVTNVNPTTPTDSNAAVNTVAEVTTNGTVVGITASSGDVNGPQVTYSLSDNAGGRFAIDDATGVVMVANSSLLDYETAASHTITVQASDGSGGTSAQSFTIAVTDVVDSVAITNGDAGGVLFGTNGNDVFDGQGGYDIILAGAGDDTVTAGTGADIVQAGSGNDIMIATAGDGNDAYLGGTGFDTLDLSRITTPVTVSLGPVIDAFGVAYGTEIGNDSLLSVEKVIGGSANDTLSGDDLANVLMGGAGRDALSGRGGVDTLDGGANDDTLDAGAGNDFLVFALGFGNDTVVGFDANAAGGQDKLDISALGITSSTFNGNVIETVVPGGTRIDIGTDSILLRGVTSANIDQTDFILLV